MMPPGFQAMPGMPPGMPGMYPGMHYQMQGLPHHGMNPAAGGMHQDALGGLASAQ